MGRSPNSPDDTASPDAESLDNPDACLVANRLRPSAALRTATLDCARAFSKESLALLGSSNKFFAGVNTSRLRFQLDFAWIALLTLLLIQDSFADAIWSNPGSGLWRGGANWSTGQAPNSDSGSTLITNANTKTVTIDALTPSANLTINSLTLSGTTGATNTLLLADVGTNRPLTLVSSDLKITQGGALVVTNSSLVLMGSFSQFDIFAGSATLESGSIRTIEDPDVTESTVLVRVGRTNSASLIINGGVMETGTLLLGDVPLVQFSAQGTLRITAGLLSLSGDLNIGDDTKGTGLVELIGGQLRVADNQTNITRIGDQGVGQMVVSNASALLGNVSVGRHDSALGTLIVQTNGVVHLTDDLSIGRFSGSTGAVWVAGGHLDVDNDPIWVGREGTGQLTVSGGRVQASVLKVAAVSTNTAAGTVSLLGGSLILSSNLVLGSDSAAVAQMSVAGGELIVTNSSGSAVLDLIRGTLTLKGGTMTLDHLGGTNPAGRLVFESGTLRTKGTAAANGLPFVVGDGIRAAVLELLGGTHTFANGLVISSNATLKGCGTVIGSITSFGTIATNCGVGPQPPVLVNVGKSGSALSFSFASENAFNYLIEYKKNLDDPGWTPLRNVAGNGTVIPIIDTIGPEPARFYRVGVE
jgi:T5SS/PEP-CTERM-associated repeat protein